MVTRNEYNKSLKRTNIRGKGYIEVAQRISGFWEMFPDWSIRTEFVHLDMEKGQCIMAARIIDQDGTERATGHAEEQRTSSSINRTSFVENCETSAIGRALGILGIGSTESVASVEEMNRALERQAENAQRAAEKPDKTRKAATTNTEPLEGFQAATVRESAQQDALKHAQAELWDAVKAYAARYGLDALKVAQDVKADPNYSDNPVALKALAAKYTAMSTAGVER